MLENFSIYIILTSIIIFLFIGNMVASMAIKRGQNAGKKLSEIKEEFEIRKSVFAIIGGVSIIIGGAFSFYEFGLKIRAEDRQLLYGALGQLIAVDDKRPEISAAALLQLERLGASSDAERPALVQIVAGYLNERAKKPVSEHDTSTTARPDSTTARPDIQMAIYVLARLLNGDHSLGGLVLLKEIDLRHVRIDGAQLVNIKLIGVDLGGASMVGANFLGSDLTATKFNEAVLQNAVFTGATIDFAEFDGADISTANFCDLNSRVKVRFDNVETRKGAKCLN